MKRTLSLICVVAVGVFCVALSQAQSTPAGGEGATTRQQTPGHGIFIEALREAGERFGCFFTLEYQSMSVTGKDPLVNRRVNADLSADSISAFVSKLRGYLDGYVVEQDSRNPKIFHIIEKALADDPNYCLNKKISVSYSGALSPRSIRDYSMPSGYKMADKGLLAAVAEKTGRIMGGSTETASGGAGGSEDHYTRINVNATDETVRSIITDCLPTNYSPVMWRATTTVMPGIDGKVWVLVQFFGPPRK